MQTENQETSSCVVAIVDTGVNCDQLSFNPQHPIKGWGLSFKANNHVHIAQDYNDISLSNRGARIVDLILEQTPDVQILAVRSCHQIEHQDADMQFEYSVTSELIAAGIETAAHAGANLILVPSSTANMGKALLLRETCDRAQEAGAVVISVGAEDGARSYPADVPGVVSVIAHRACVDKIRWLSPRRFSRREWRSLSGSWLGDGRQIDGGFWGGEAAAARVTAEMAAIYQSLYSQPEFKALSPPDVSLTLRRAYQQHSKHCLFELDLASHQSDTL